MDIMRLADWLPQSKMTLITDAIAVGALATPWWFSELQEVSGVFALLFPIAGTIWLVTQTVVKIYMTWRVHSSGHDDEPET